MSGSVRGMQTRWSLAVLLAVVLGALVAATPASAASQNSSISQSCNAGDSGSNGSSSSDGSGDSGGSSSSGDSSSSGGSCSNQRRVVQQRAGGDVSFSINQSQSFGGERHAKRRQRDNSTDNGGASARASEDDSASSSDNGDSSASATTDDLDCRDFSSQGDAQATLDQDSSDPNNLDRDHDGKACEDFFTQHVTGAPSGGVETGGGGTLAPRLARAEGSSVGPAAQVARIAGPVVALGLIALGLVGLRRGRNAS